MGRVQHRDQRGKRAVGLLGFAAYQWHEVEYRFARLGIHDPGEVEYGRFCRLLLASLHDGLTDAQRADLDVALSPVDPEQVAAKAAAMHPGAHQALGLQASPEYQRVMTDPRSTPVQRARAREQEMARQRKLRERREAGWRR